MSGSFDEAMDEFMADLRAVRDTAAPDPDAGAQAFLGAPDDNDTPYVDDDDTAFNEDDLLGLGFAEAAEVVEWASENWDELSEDGQEAVVRMQEALTQAEDLERRVAEAGAERFLSGLERSGYDRDVFWQLLERHDGDVETALAAIHEIGPKSERLDGAVDQWFREQKALGGG